LWYDSAGCVTCGQTHGAELAKKSGCTRDSAPLAIVTGGAGFLGSHLCARLLRDGCRVIAIDDLSTGNRNNLAALQQFSNFTLLQNDISTSDLNQLLVLGEDNLHSKLSSLHRVQEPGSWRGRRGVEPLHIFNLACPASPIQYQRMPLQTMKTCVIGALNMLELARKTGAKILQASTSEVYGSAQVTPQEEGYWGYVNPCGVRSCYDEGKRAAEAIFFDHNREYGTQIKVARIFNTYGPGMALDDGRVVSNFVVQALRGESLTVFGDGSQTRSLCYVDDLIDGLVVLMGSSDEVLGPVNLGNPHEVTMLALAKLIKELTGSKSKIVFRSLPQDDPVRRMPDITRAKVQLGWEPKVALVDGLERTIAHVAERLTCRVQRRRGL
jgi:UDP-glucuronate decarboxylase